MDINDLHDTSFPIQMYGVEVWEGCRQTEPLQVQLPFASIFLGVGRLHTRSAFEYEMRMMLLGWVSKGDVAIEFWKKY